MKLKTVIQGLAVEVKGSKEIDISGLACDSRRTAPGNLFIAKRGTKADGTEYLAQAVENGATAVLTRFYDPFLKATQLIHPAPESIEAALASRFYRQPSKELFVFAVTGTKGKTTTTYLAKHLFDFLGRPAGLSGSVEMVVKARRAPSTMATQDLLVNHKLLREMVDAGCNAAVLEVSSHGLHQGRVAEIAFDAALFTNLMPDHLDYHSTMEEYALAKQILFRQLEESPKQNKLAIANADDPWTPRILEGCKAPQLLFGLGDSADVRAEAIELSAAGTRFVVCARGERQIFTTHLIGRFNVYNLLGAISLGLSLGCSLEELSICFASFHGVPGRLERVKNSTGKHVFVDYAHMGEALENVLSTLKQISTGKIITVFGAGGNRDPGRRKGLAQAAEKFSDLCVVTSDNPREEDPQEIVRQILAAFQQPKAARVELDRKKAIELAIGLAGPGDLVLIAGKGHEKVQIFAHQTVPFDDCAVALAALEAGG